MTEFRWRLFKLLSRLGWIICPEPYRSEMLADMRGALKYPEKK